MLSCQVWRGQAIVSLCSGASIAEPVAERTGRVVALFSCAAVRPTDSRGYRCRRCRCRCRGRSIKFNRPYQLVFCLHKYAMTTIAVGDIVHFPIIGDRKFHITKYLCRGGKRCPFALHAARWTATHLKTSHNLFYFFSFVCFT